MKALPLHFSGCCGPHSIAGPKRKSPTFRQLRHSNGNRWRPKKDSSRLPEAHWSNDAKAERRSRSTQLPNLHPVERRLRFLQAEASSRLRDLQDHPDRTALLRIRVRHLQQAVPRKVLSHRKTRSGSCRRTRSDINDNLYFSVKSAQKWVI